MGPNKSNYAKELEAMPNWTNAKVRGLENKLGPFRKELYISRASMINLGPDAV